MKKYTWIVYTIVATAFCSEAIETMDELIVQSTRIETPLELMSSSIEVITAEELQASGVSYVADALLLQPGISGSRSGGPGQATQLYLRGAKPQHTLIIVDGVRMNGQLDLNGYDLANLDLTSVERIEILKGPQSTLYGSDAMAGVINIITTKSQTPRRYIQREKGRYGAEYTTAGISGGTEQLFYTLTFFDYRNQGFSSLKNNKETDALENETFFARLDGSLSEQTQWHLSVRYIDAIGHYDDSFGTAHTKYYYDKEQLITRLAVDHTITDAIRTQVGISYLDLTRAEHGAYGVSEYLADTLSYDWNITAQPNHKNTLLFGFEGHEDTYEIGESSTTTGDLNNHAILGLWQHQPRTGTALSLSAREDHHSQFGQAFTYQGGLSHTFAQSDTRLYASYGTGFKAPSSYQSYNNPTLKAEESKGWEIGLEQPLIDNLLQVELALFQKEYSQFIDYVRWEAGPIYTNATTARSDGFEAGLTLYPTDTLTLRMSYSYLDNDSVDTTFSTRRPTHKLDSTLHWQATKRLQLNALIGYVGNRQGVVSKMESYIPVQLAARYQANDTLTLYAHLENLLNEEYELANGYNTPRQGLYGGMRIDF
jgi:vitamin B12 transporter